MSYVHYMKKEIESANIVRRSADSLEKSDISVDDILNPSNEKDLRKIKYYKRIDDTIKEKFLQFEVSKFKRPVVFSKKTDPKMKNGSQWDKRLSDYIKKIPPQTNELSEMSFSDYVCRNPVEYELFKAIDKIHNDWSIVFEESKFALFGFMRERATDGKKTPKLYMWQGEADAIAYSRKLKKFIIVDFKVVDNLLYYWQKKTDLCGNHLHQCLVYAKLLQLHMCLDYLPPIMIVVIDGVTGTQGFFPLFEDYPEECKGNLDEYEWFTKQPPKPPLKMVKNDKLFHEDIVDNEMYQICDCVGVSLSRPLNEIFKDTVTLGDLLEALHLDYDAVKIVSHLDK